MNVLILFLIVLGVVLFGLAGFRIGTARIHFGWLGAAAFGLAYLLANLPSH